LRPGPVCPVRAGGNYLRRCHRPRRFTQRSAPDDQTRFGNRLGPSGRRHPQSAPAGLILVINGPTGPLLAERILSPSASVSGLSSGHLFAGSSQQSLDVVSAVRAGPPLYVCCLPLLSGGLVS